MKIEKNNMAILCALTGVLALGIYLGRSGMPLINSAEAAGGNVLTPTAEAPERYAYYPGTEALGQDEIRIVACGTGMPSRPIFWSRYGILEF